VPAREQRPHDLRVPGSPERAPGEARGIDDVPDEHDGFGLDAAQELIQLAHAGMQEPQVDWASQGSSGNVSAR
jgi:hypothetical protein